MKHSITFAVFLSISLIAFSQNPKKIQKSWIKISSENLSGQETEPDTLYTRYSFDKFKLYISFYPGWDDYQKDWSANANHLKIGFDTYHIEELTDTSLVIKIDGFRKFSFLSEDYLTTQEKYLEPIGEYKGKPLYRANNFVTPRYKKRLSLQKVLEQNTEDYNIKRATIFLVKFIITENGEVENIKIVKGITEGFDSGIIKQLQSTSKDWRAARYKSVAIQTEMLYQIKYLNSITR